MLQLIKMKKLLGIVVLGLMWCSVGFAKPQYLVCEISKYIVKENVLKNEVQKPLNEINSTWLNKEFITIDFEKKAIMANSMELSSPKIWLWDLEEIIFRYDEENEVLNKAYRLNRITGELKVKISNKPGMEHGDTIGFHMKLFYDCEIEEKKF